MKQKVPQIHLIYNRRKTASPTKKASVEIRVTYDYKQKYISTGIMLYPNQWKNGIITNCDDIMQISQILEKQVTNVRQILIDMLEEGNINLQELSKRLENRNKGKISFIGFCLQRAEIRKYGKRKDTQERYDRFIRLFLKWGKIKNFEDINDVNIMSLDLYLLSKGMKQNSKWHNYHRFLNSFISDAVEEGHVSRNPYKWVNIPRTSPANSINKYLSPEEFAKIKIAKMPTESLNRIKDVFIFQTYTCLSYSDLRNFNTDAIKTVKGMKVYVGSRVKTDKNFIVPLLKPALDILDKYNNTLPIISNVKYNEYLKLVAQAAGIDKPVSTHWARHTGATLLLNEGVDMRIVSKICGHSSMKMTEQVYAKLLDETVVEALLNLSI